MIKNINQLHIQEMTHDDSDTSNMLSYSYVQNYKNEESLYYLKKRLFIIFYKRLDNIIK